ncbi:hypothetical protein [Neorhizobium sp. T6_25]|uniref:hypothetical protein n=1 Tax=Neorhizobium sp. T6_25 TaxID=2093833 RepID=UPI000CF9169A|nr:hypothetical protein [Neorhizobium sp. T6_25]
MSIKPVIQSKTEKILEREAVLYGVTATAMAKAIVETVAHEGIIHEILADVDLSKFSGQPGRRVSGRYELDGRAVKLSDLAAMSGVKEVTIRRRIKNGMPIEQALSASDMRKREARV